MIIGTAGHIDHGKSTLMEALTGTHTDRLPEEKRRGISIELGYAFLDAPDGRRVAFVDVPGHEKLIHAMVSGASGMDHVMLLVAADDGVMPQTREHWAICSLLGLNHLTVVITKADRADDAQLSAVNSQIDALLGECADAPRFVVCAPTGQGVDALKAHLLALSVSHSDDQSEMAFRLPIDRSFSLNGIGTVVTGSVHRGAVHLDDELLCSHQPTQAIRVRGLHAQNRKVAQATQGERCAVNLAQVSKDDCPRGSWLLAPHLAQTTERLDGLCTVWHEEAKPLHSGTVVWAYWGTQQVMATVAVLQAQAKDELQAGEQGWVQLVFKTPVLAWWGEHILLRDASATRTVGGLQVMDTLAPRRYRRTPERLQLLYALNQVDWRHRLEALVQASPQGVDGARFEASQGLRVGTILRHVADGHSQILVLKGQHGAWYLWSRQRIEGLWVTVQAALSNYHHQQPEDVGPDVSRLRRMAAPKLEDPIWQLVCQQWMDAGLLKRKGARLQLPEHSIRLSASDERIAQKVMPKLLAGRFDPPWVRDLAVDVQESETLVRVVMCRLAAQGELFQVVKDLFYPQATLHTLAQIARRLAQQEGEVLAARFRDETGLGRKRAIQILECLDRVGFLRRWKDKHVLRKDALIFSEPEREVA